MNKKLNNENLNDVISISKRILKVVYVLLIVASVYIFLRIIKELHIFHFVTSLFRILTPLFIGIVVAWLINPFIKWLEKKKVRRLIGTLFAYLIIIGCIALLVNAIIPLLYNQIIELVDNFPRIFASVKNWIADILGRVDSKYINIDTIEKNVINRLDVFSSDLSTSLPSLIINGASSAVSSVGTFIIGLVIGFFLTLSCSNLSVTLLEMFPKRFQNPISELCKKINLSLRNYVNGALLDTFVVFLVSTVAFAIIGLKAPILFGLFCGLMNIIPYAGPYIGGAPAVIVGFSQGTGIGIAVLIAIVIIQTIEGNFLQTLIISRATKLNPVTIIIGLLIFGHFFGIPGMLFSTPIIGVLKVIIKYLDDKYNIFKFDLS